MCCLVLSKGLDDGAIVTVQEGRHGVEEHEVREGAPDVEADPVLHQPATSASTRAMAERARTMGQPPAAAFARAFIASE
jgi:hypothetical protein